MSAVRILVLTSSTGAGHDERANAFREWCRELYGAEVDVRIEQMLEDSSRLYRCGVDFYNWIQRRAPWLHSAYFTFVELLGLINRRSVSFGRRHYEKVLREYRPHLVFSVHDCLNRGYFQVAREVLGAANVRCATYCGEFSGGFGYSANWVEPSADLYVSRTSVAREHAVRLGMPRERTRVRGHFMRPRVHRQVMPAEDRREFLVRHLGLRSDRFTVFLATGGNGANNHLELLPQLLPHKSALQAIVICGRNRVAYDAAREWSDAHPELPCFVDGYSDQVFRLIQVSDAIVTRGGTTTCAKALHYGCPIIFNAFGGIMPQERLTVNYFRSAAGSAQIANAAEFGRVIERWMSDRDSYASHLKSFRALQLDEDPTTVIRELVDLAQESAQTRLVPRNFFATSVPA